MSDTRWVVLFGGGKNYRVYGAFSTQDNEHLKTYDRIEDARAQKHVIRTKWPYLNAWVVELDMKPQPTPPVEHEKEDVK